MPVSVIGLVGPTGQLLSKSSALGSNAATFHHHHHPRDNSCPGAETRPGHPQSQVLDNATSLASILLSPASPQDSLPESPPGKQRKGAKG